MSGQIRVGIVGAGFFGGTIADACIRHDEFAVVAVADAVAEAASRLAERTGARAEALDDLVRDPEVDLVVVATPNHLHAEPAIAALQAGKHVFVEKPLAITAEDADAIVAAAELSAGRLIVGHIERTFPAVRDMVRRARAGELGTISEVYGSRRRVVHLPSDRADWWKLDPKRTGGELLHEVHELDLVVWALGAPSEAETLEGAPRAHGETELPSEWVTTMRLPSGAIGVHSLSTSANRAEWIFRISGSEATLEADFRAATLTRYVDGRAVSTEGIFADPAVDDSLRAASQAAQAYNAAGSEGPLWMRIAAEGELDEVALAVRGESEVLVEAPADAVRVALRSKGAPA